METFPDTVERIVACAVDHHVVGQDAGSASPFLEELHQRPGDESDEPVREGGSLGDASGAPVRVPQGALDEFVDDSLVVEPPEGPAIAKGRPPRIASRKAKGRMSWSWHL